jgi:hypothetical protein
MTMTDAKRPYQSFPEVRVETKYGALLVVFNGGDSLCIRTDSRPGQRDLITVRGVEYSINAHLTREGNGWRISGANSYEQRQMVHVSRVDWINHGEASEPARKTIATLVFDVAAEAATAELSKQGRLVTINNAVGSLDEKIAKARAELDEMEDQRARLRAEEALLVLEEE